LRARAVARRAAFGVALRTNRLALQEFPMEVAAHVARFVRRHLPVMLCCAVLPAWAAAQEATDATLVAGLRQEAAAYEHGNGVTRDGPRAAALYCRAARLGDAASQFDLGWMYAYGRGVKRDDALAAFFFQAAAGQGIEQAKTMLLQVGAPSPEPPDCMRPAAAPLPEFEPAPRQAALPALPASAPKAIVALVKKMAPQYRVPPHLVLAIMQAESNFDPAAVSPRNAQGLMQLIPDTAARFRVKNPFDAAQNIRGGIAYLRWLLAYFEGDVALVAAAYNAGEGTVERYRGVPPYEETRAYVQRILAAVGAVSQPFDASITGPSPQLRLIRAPDRGH
jgi:soluble lytic murein transglycosylase-like protein